MKFPRFSGQPRCEDVDADRRGLAPLFWTHVAPYGEVRLDMCRHLQRGGPAEIEA